MKKGVYELGGSDPYIVFADADIENAAQQCAQARLLNSGQSCIAAKRFLVVDAVHDPFVDALTDAMRQYPMGDPRDEATKIGPLARADLRDNLRRQVEQSLEAGAKLRLGGSSESPGYFYQPTILTDVKPGMPAFDEETFGPLAAVVRCNDEDEALELAAKTSFGLGSAIFSADVERAWELARHRLHAGNCAINTFVKSDPDAPFGGIKESGYGRELGQAGIREFMNAKTITVG
jgi:succinate-semialdehyde dehydrogenase/glutarate-semialdehyde dehydrogenase